VGGPAHRPSRWNVRYCHLNAHWHNDAGYCNPNGYYGSIDCNAHANEYYLCGYCHTHANRHHVAFHGNTNPDGYDLWRHGNSYANEYHSSFELVSKRYAEFLSLSDNLRPRPGPRGPGLFSHHPSTPAAGRRG
jgi:hypothetical protein